jgi:hypothetical protein
MAHSSKQNPEVQNVLIITTFATSRMSFFTCPAKMFFSLASFACEQDNRNIKEHYTGQHLHKLKHKPTRLHQRLRSAYRRIDRNFSKTTNSSQAAFAMFSYTQLTQQRHHFQINQNPDVVLKFGFRNASIKVSK